MPKPRIVVVSPFIDKRHGTERIVAEGIERLASECEIHVYSNRVEDLNLNEVTWHRIPRLPGPHIFSYLWWFLANHLWRWYDRQFRNLVPEMVYSPGINCLDADTICVHVLFASLIENLRGEMQLSRNPVKTWPQVVHRRVYYRLIQFLEGRVYPNSGRPLAVVSRKVARDLNRYYRRTDQVYIVYKGFDLSRFNPEVRAPLRPGARAALGLAESDFVLLLIGNGWKNKGLPCLLESVGLLQDSRLVVLVVGQDNPAPYQAVIERHKLNGRVHFLSPRADVEFFYAAADSYVGPSLEDSFTLPPAEAMACGLPVITSREAGCSEIVSHGLDGLILEDPRDIRTLAEWIRKLLDNTDFCSRLAANAVLTAQKFTRENSISDIEVLFEQVRLGRKKQSSSQQESTPAKE